MRSIYRNCPQHSLLTCLYIGCPNPFFDWDTQTCNQAVGTGAIVGWRYPTFMYKKQRPPIVCSGDWTWCFGEDEDQPYDYRAAVHAWQSTKIGFGAC